LRPPHITWPSVRYDLALRIDGVFEASTEQPGDCLGGPRPCSNATRNDVDLGFGLA
jgi:hypothetical protein